MQGTRIIFDKGRLCYKISVLFDKMSLMSVRNSVIQLGLTFITRLCGELTTLLHQIALCVSVRCAIELGSTV